MLDTNNTFNIGKRNYLALRKIFWKAGVLVHHEEVGGTLPRSVRMEVGSGRIVVYHGREEREITQGRTEREPCRLMAFNVLLVDDSPSMRKVIRRVLTLSGFRCRCTCLEAGDGLEALQVLEDAWIDVVITDINMPNMNGEELVVKMSEDPMRSYIPVLVVSTDRSDERLARMMALGARGICHESHSCPRRLGQPWAKLSGSLSMPAALFESWMDHSVAEVLESMCFLSLPKRVRLRHSSPHGYLGCKPQA